MELLIPFFITYGLFAILFGPFAMAEGIYSDMWDAGNIAGKIVTILLVILSLPGILVYFVIVFLGASFSFIKDLLFPRASGYTMKVPYDEETYKSLQNAKIYCEHWGQIDIPSSKIVFLCKSDWKKALKLFPELESKVKKY